MGWVRPQRMGGCFSLTVVSICVVHCRGASLDAPTEVRARGIRAGAPRRACVSVAGGGAGGWRLAHRAASDHRWAWAGGAVALLIWAPNLVWEARHHFVSFDFLRSIHARDVSQGRTRSFLPDQLTHTIAALWIAGLYFYFRKPAGERYRALGWTFVAALALFAMAHARDYYTAPLYPMLLAAGAVGSGR